MMNIKSYFDNLLKTKGYDAYEAANDELINLVLIEEQAEMLGEEIDVVAPWAKAHGIDLEAGHVSHGCFFTYYTEWYRDNFED